jgi:squalene-hopene/tetraprenyl-beta-curcumene cyclase
VDFIMTLQTAEGGIGYSDKTPGWADLSNTQYALESLRAAGVPADAPVFSKALQFLQRVQNRSESNNVDYKLEDGRIVVSLDDGGGFYSPTESKADMVEVGDGKWAFRSYGSMTYALLKCYLLAGLPKNDPRVRDAVKWIGNHYTLSENPGFDTAKTPDAGQQGLYYYYLTMARALTLLGEAKVKDADGIEHDWKAEMRDRLRAMQRKDGSWANPKDRWMEGHPVLATSFALGAFSCCI